MDTWKTLFDVLVLLTAALAAGVVLERLKQSAIIGYLLAGMALGPHALHLVEKQEEVDMLAELGVALLLFSIGLEFSWRRMMSMGKMAFGGGALQVTITLAAAAGACLAFNLDWKSSIVIGAAVTLSSTAVVLRLLMRRAELDSLHGRNSVAILLAQDIAVVPLVVTVTLLGKGGGMAEAGIALAKTLGYGAGLVIAFYLLFNYVVPRLLGSQLMARNRDLPILLALITAIGSAWTAHAAGLSPALGAFVAGMLLAESPFAAQVRADVGSLRILLVTLFFSSVGMLADPLWMFMHAPLLIGVVAAIIIGKTVITSVVVRLMDQTPGHSAATGVCLAQVGEFSFVLATIAYVPNSPNSVLDESTFALLISATILTMLIAPYQVVLAPIIGRRIGRWLQKAGVPAEVQTRDEDDDRPRIVIVGFGPAGQSVGSTLVRSDAVVTVLETSRRGVDVAHQMGHHGMRGDGTTMEMLEHAGVDQAAVVIITVPDPTTARRVIENVRAINRQSRIVVRARYHVYRWELLLAGADVVVDEEEQMGRRLSAEMRKQLRLGDDA